MKELLLIRHGITEFNEQLRYCGWSDSYLSIAGRKDLEKKRDLYLNQQFDAYYSSDLTRCLQTFEILFPDQKLKKTVSELREIYFNTLEGVKEPENRTENFIKFFEGKNDHFEKLPDFLARIEKGLKIVCQDMDENGYQKVAIITHSALMMTILMVYYELEPKYFFDLFINNGEGLKIIIDDHKIKEIKYYPYREISCIQEKILLKK